MILKKKFPSGAEQNVDLGSNYLLINKDKSAVKFNETAKEFFGEAAEELAREVEAFIIYHEGQITPKKTEVCYRKQYNAIMSDSGKIYNVVTCMD